MRDALGRDPSPGTRQLTLDAFDVAPEQRADAIQEHALAGALGTLRAEPRANAPRDAGACSTNAPTPRLHKKPSTRSNTPRPSAAIELPVTGPL